jgi:hypothetical protein
VLAAVKDKPSGRPQAAAVLDRHCARRPHHRAGRDGRMAPPRAEPKNASLASSLFGMGRNVVVLAWSGGTSYLVTFLGSAESGRFSVPA